MVMAVVERVRPNARIVVFATSRAKLGNRLKSRANQGLRGLIDELVRTLQWLG
jgi:hypothetical protein